MTVMPYPIDIARLKDLLRTEPLDPTFEEYGNFIVRLPLLVGGKRAYPDNVHMVHFFGNFANYSFVFGFDTDEQMLIDELEALILANKESAAYQEAKDELARNKAFWEARNAQKERARRAQEVQRAKDALAKYGVSQ